VVAAAAKKAAATVPAVYKIAQIYPKTMSRINRI